MGQKVNPTGIRLGIVKKHTSVWYASGKDYADHLLQDMEIRDMVKKKLAAARSQYGNVSKKDLGSNENKFELTKLERAVNSNRELYELFLSRFNEVELGIDSVSSNTQILERAATPLEPFSPNVQKEVSRGGVIGLILGILLLLFREIFDRTFKTAGRKWAG